MHALSNDVADYHSMGALCRNELTEYFTHTLTRHFIKDFYYFLSY